MDPDNIQEGLVEAERIISDTPTEQPVVLYCSVGYRSSMVADQLLKLFNSKGKYYKYTLCC